MKKKEVFEQTWNNVFSLRFFFKGLRFLLLNMSMSWLIIPSLRPRILSLLGVDFKDPRSVFIGKNVFFDITQNTKITVGTGVTLTMGVVILTHYYVPEEKKYVKGDIRIGDNVFIGINSLIVNSVSIGDGSVIGAGSVVTKDVAPHTIVAGVPARELKTLTG
jgi:acetyltransferase-like isoleucine patch superfamily enzyme